MDITHDSERVYVAALGGLMIIDKATGEKAYYSNLDGSFDYTPTALAVHDGKVWIGTKSINNEKESKLLIYDGQTIAAYDFAFDSYFISNII